MVLYKKKKQTYYRYANEGFSENNEIGGPQVSPDRAKGMTHGGGGYHVKAPEMNLIKYY